MIAQFPATWDIGHIIVAIIIIAAVVAIAVVAMRKFEITPPDWAVKIFWIVAVAIVAIMAIKFLLSQW
jgi:hypothetical protein